MVKNGLTMASAGPAGDPQSMGELAHIAEESGWEGFFLEDYIVWQSHPEVPTYDPWITLGVIATRTQRLRLGTKVTPLARRRPWKVAQELVTLDHLSNGRVILGVGLGDAGGDLSFTQFNEMLDPRRRARMLDEAIEIITRVWSGEPFSFDGEFYTIREIQILPKPVQQPRIPVWVGGGYPNRGPLERALRWDGSCMYRQQGHWMQPEDVRHMRELLIERRGTADGYDISVGGGTRWEDEDEQRLYMQSIVAEGVTWWCEYIPPDTGDFEVMRKLIERGPLRID